MASPGNRHCANCIVALSSGLYTVHWARAVTGLVKFNVERIVQDVVDGVLRSQ